MVRLAVCTVFSFALVLATLALILQAAPADGQVQPNIEAGFKSYGSYDSTKIDTVNLDNGGLTIHIPLPLSYPQRGGKIDPSYFMVANSKAWQVQVACTQTLSYLWSYGAPIGCAQFLMGGAAPLGPYLTNTLPAALQRYYYFYSDQNGNVTEYANDYSIRDWDGSVHALTNISGGTSLASIDTSGFHLALSNPDTYGVPQSFVLTDRRGDVTKGSWPLLSGPCSKQIVGGSMGHTMTICNGGPSVKAATDTNGNVYFTTDTLGRSLPLSSSSSSSTSGCVSSVPLTGSTFYTYTGVSGATEKLQACLGSVTLKTSFGQSGVQEYSGTTPLIVTLISPNNTKWTLTYDGYGNVTKLGLPAGGSVSYTWQTISLPNCGGNDAKVSRAVSTRTLYDGTNSYTWKYTWGTWSQTATNVVTDPLNNDTVHVFGVSSCDPYEITNKAYQGSSITGGQLLRETDTTYSSAGYDCNGFGCPGNVVPTYIKTIDYASGMITAVAKSYDPGYGGTAPIFGNVISESDYDWGTGSPGPLLKQTSTTYEFQNNTNYLTGNLPDLLASVIVSNGAGYKCSETDYTYDNASYLTAANVTTQHVSPPGPVRGNLSSVAQQLSSTPCQSGATWSPLTSYTNMYDTGEIYKSTDPLSHTTTFAYSSTFAGAYATTVTNALNQSTAYNYDLSTGLMTSVTDPNQLTTSYSFDSMFRLSQVVRPDGGQSSIAYQESADPFSATMTTQINSNQSKTEVNVFDGLGRTKQYQLTSDPQGTDYTDTNYDALGRVATISNPYRTGTDGTTSSGTTAYSYDPLSRKTQEKYPDNSVLNTAYCGPSTLVTDPTLKWRRSRVDGIGRLVEVDEPNSTTASVSANGCPSTGDPIWSTAYTFDALGDLTTVLQNGSRQRNFTYDSLSRLLTANNPESGIITYTYNADNTVFTRQDARAITATYSYDAIRRETGRTYSNGDPALSFTYDQTACLGLSACQNIGHRTSMTDGAGSELWAYQVDKANLRSIHVDQRTNNSSPNNVTKTATYYFDLAGNATQMVYPTGRTINYSYNSADRPSAAADSANGITYATGWQTPPTGTACTASAVCYTPQGSPYAMSLGQSSGFTGFNISETFNSRLQPNELKSFSSAGTAMDLSYNYVDPVSLGNAGQVYSITNNVNASRSQSFNYDQLNRIASAGTSATSGTYCWGYQFSYDAWSNLLAQAAWTPTYNGCSETTMSASANANNQLFGYSYDASGNMLGDGINTYAFNAESQLKTGAGVSYAYDGDGRRIAKVGSKLYWYGSSGETLAETDASGNIQNEYVFFGGRRIADLPAGSGALYYAPDILDSSRAMVQSNGTECYDADFTPFGGERAYTTACSQNYKFTGKERDSESGLDEFGKRYYGSIIGRFMTPDRIGYSGLDDPQSLNLYSYVGNHPTSMIDPDGRCWKWAQWICDQAKDTGQRFDNLFHGEGFHTNNGVEDIAHMNNAQRRDQEVKPNPYVKAATDFIGVLTLAAGKRGDKFGKAGAIVSMLNDPSPKNLAENGIPFLVPETGFAITVYGIAEDGSEFAANQVIIPVLTPDASQSSTVENGNGYLIPNPEFEDVCQVVGGCQ